MSENELPEDVASWPRNPFQLLGVTPRDEHSVVKRAYTRLIRRFKPEHFPEQFRRLREAYEAIVHSSAQSYLTLPSTASSAPSSPPHDAPNPVETETATAAPNGFQWIWQQAREGHVDEALEGLRSKHWVGNQLLQARVTEYWLTKLKYPEPANSLAGRILVENFHFLQSVSEVLPLVRSELHAHPELVERIDFEKCIDGVRTPYEIENILRIRWAAALRCSKFDLIQSDYALLAHRYFEYRELREMIAILAIDHLIWSFEREQRVATGQLITDLEKLSGLRPERAGDFDRLDYLLCLHRQLLEVWTVHPQWHSTLRMIPYMWNGLEADVVNQASSWLVGARQHIAQALAFFDIVGVNGILFAYLIAQFERAIRCVGPVQDEERFDELATVASQWRSEPPNEFDIVLIEDFLDSYHQEPYEQFRIRTAEFCLQNQVPAQKVIQYIVESDSPYARFFRIEWVGRLALDESLHTLIGLLQKMTLVTSVQGSMQPLP